MGASGINSRAPATFNAAGDRVVRAEWKDPLDKLVTTVRMKDHCECTAGGQLVPVELEEMHTIVTAKGLCGRSRIRYRRS
jgi:hypothetical protein